MLAIFRSLRGRLAMLVLATSAPAIAVIAYLAVNQHSQAIEQAQREAFNAAKTISDELDYIVRTSEAGVVALSNFPNLKSPGLENCTDTLTQIDQVSALYTALSVYNTVGRVVCSSLPSAIGADLSDRDYFKGVVTTKALTIGEFVIGRVSRKAVLPMAQPILDSTGNFHSAIAATIDIATVERSMAGLLTARGITVEVVDRSGKVIMNVPPIEAGGRERIEPGLLSELRARPSGLTEIVRDTGVMALAGFMTIRASNPIGYVVATLPKDLAGSGIEGDALLAILAIVAMAGLASAAVWYAGDAFLVRPIRALVTASEALEGGRVDARVSSVPAISELARMTSAFNHMASAISSREVKLQTQLVELKRVNSELDEKGRILHQAQKMEAVGQLSGGLAHDFNNLLTVVLGNIGLIEDTVKDNPRLAKRLEAARLAARRGADLTGRLLAFSRQQVLEPAIVNISTLVAGLQDMLRRTLSENVKMSLVLASGLPSTRLDANQFESALLNLAINARDAMPKGGTLTIETADSELSPEYVAAYPGLEAGPYVMVAVTDTGTGMSPEVVERVFEPFFTTKAPGKGTGLGLSMVYGFAKQSGGHVNIYSEIGRGTTIRLYFPRSNVAASGVKTDDRSMPKGSEKILVVEDNPSVRDIAVAMLEDLGYDVRIAEDGPSALKSLDADSNVHLVLTDFVMPGGMNGTELGKRVRKLYPLVKIVYTSGYAEGAVRTHTGDDADEAWIAKPYEKHRLAQKLRAVLDEPVRSLA